MINLPLSSENFHLTHVNRDINGTTLQLTSVKVQLTKVHVHIQVEFNNLNVHMLGLV
jgi:hypothetical protein